MSRLAIFIGCLLCISPHYLARTDPARVVTVCEVMQDLSLFGNKTEMIAVRGQWDGNLWGDCPSRQTEGFVWPNAIWVDLPTSPLISRSPNIPIDLKATFDISVYEAALEGAWDRWDRLPTEEKRRSSVMVTIVGRLAVNPRGLLIRGGLPDGFGFQGVYPAQLVVSELRDITIAPVSKRVVTPRTTAQ